MTFEGQMRGHCGTISDFWRSLGVSLEDSCIASWFCWQNTGGCWVQLLMTQVGLSGLAGSWRAVLGLYCKLIKMLTPWLRWSALGRVIGRYLS